MAAGRPSSLPARVGAVVLAGLTGCGPRAPHDAAVDAVRDATDARADVAPAVDFVVTVLSADRRPIVGARVFADRAGDEPVESLTDGSGVAHLRLSLSGRGWDITASYPGHMIGSVLGVDAPLEQPLVLLRPPDRNPARLPISGTIEGRADLVHTVLVAPRIGEATEAMLIPSQFQAAYYMRSVSPDQETPPLRLAAIEYDTTGRLINGALTDEIPRTGLPIANVQIRLPSPPRPVHSATATVIYPGEGILAPTGAIALRGTLVGQIFGWDPVWLLGLSSGFDPPVEGRTQWHVEHFAGDMAPDRFIAQLLVINNGSWLAEIHRTTLHDGDTVRLPVVRALGVLGSSLGEAAIEVDADNALTASFQVDDSSGLPIWYGYLQHPDRVVARRLPRLPPGVSLRERHGDEVQVLVVAGFDRLLAPSSIPYLDASPSILVLNTPLPISTEGR